ncbi:MAG: GyrI-like domain-containing protein, partial [Ekhidna sp.]
IGAQASSSIDPEMIGQVMGETYGKVMSYMSANNIEAAGAPISIVLSYGEEGTEMICGLPTVRKFEVDGEGIVSGMTYEGLALKTIHKGDYDLMESAYYDLLDYMSYYNFDENGNPWEVYVTDPGVVTDTAEWVTEIYFPVK